MLNIDAEQTEKHSADITADYADDYV